jgi:hypothetical protein
MLVWKYTSLYGDVVVQLTSPSGTTVTLISAKCDDWSLDATFDDLGRFLNCSSTSPTISGG